MRSNRETDVHLVERAMVTIRRSQTRRSLARLAESSPPPRRRRTAPLTAGQAEVLDVLEAAEQDGEAATVSTVAAALGVDQPRASRLVTSAVDSGLVRRVADQEDGRRSLLLITPAGRGAIEQVREFRRSVFGAALDGWPARERREFARLLTRFVAGLPQQKR